MPEPRISSHPPCLQSRQPAPSQTKQSTSTSAEGSVNGKNDGRKRIRDAGPNIWRANSASVPLRSPIVMARSTASPSTWWNIGECDMTATSRRRPCRGRTSAAAAAASRFCGHEGGGGAEELGQDALAAEEPDADLLKLGGGLRGGDGLTRFLRDRVDARMAHELPALRLGGLGELREPLGVAHRHLGQDLAIEQDPGPLEPGHEPRVREPDLPARGVDADDPEAAEEALLLLSPTIGERAGAEDGLGRRTVELAPSADVPLRLLEDLLAPAACLRSTLCSWHTSRPPRSEIGHERPQTALVARVDQLVRAEVPAPLLTLLLELVLLPPAGTPERPGGRTLQALGRPALGLHFWHRVGLPLGLSCATSGSG